MAHKLGEDPGRDRVNDDSGSDSEQNTERRNDDFGCSSRMGRRKYLKTGLTAAAITAGAATGLGGASETIEREGIEFERVLNAVDDLSMDPTGSQSVTGQIADVPANTLVQFPDGEYLIDERLDLARLGNVGFEAVGDATIVGASGFSNTSWNIRDSDAIYYAGFTHDQSDGAVGHFWRVSDRIEIHDIDVVGRGGDWGVEMCPSITDPDGVARVVNYTNKKGSSWASYAGSGGRMGFYLGQEHEGTVQFIDCDLREYGNNALYTSRCPGNVQVFDSYFENNNVASVRIGGEGSFVENTRIVVDEDRYTGPRLDDEDKAFNMRGVLLEENHINHGQKAAGAAVRGCEIVIEENPTWAPAIMSWSNGRSIEVTDTTITYENSGGYVIKREDYSSKASHPAGDPPRWLRMDNVTITGSGDVPVAVDVEDADGTEIRNSSIHMTDHDQDGIRIVNSTDCVIEETNIVVPGTATDFESSEVETRNLTHEVLDGDETDETDETADATDTDDGEDSDVDDDGGDADDFTYEQAEGVHTELPTEFVIEQTQSGERVSYELEVDGELEAGEWEHPPEVDGTTATGGMGPGYGLDNLYFSGEVTAFDGENLDLVRVLIADAQTREVIREVDPETFPENDQLPNSLEIVSDSDLVTYKFTVAGELTDDSDSEYDTSGNISGSSAEGTVQEGEHAFRYSGEIADISVSDGATVYRNGELYLGEEGSDGDDSTGSDGDGDDAAGSDLDSVVTFDGSRTDEISSYRFSVTGDVVPDEDRSTGDGEDWDGLEGNITNGTVVGLVHTDVDAYRFSGDLVELELRGSSEVTFDNAA